MLLLNRQVGIGEINYNAGLKTGNNVLILLRSVVEYVIVDLQVDALLSFPMRIHWELNGCTGRYLRARDYKEAL